MNAGVQLRQIGPAEAHLLIAMYETFDPLGAALGLPPHTREARRRWIANAVCETVNVAAFSPAGETVGHAFLAPDNPGSAEIAVFVHQDFRRRGIGVELLREALEWGRAVHLRRVWAVTASENRAALRLLTRCGFRLVRSDSDVAEFDLDLDVLRGTRDLVEMSRPPIPYRTGSTTNQEEF